MSKPYSEKQLDALKEVINIGGGHAATSISQLIEKPVHMTVPVIEALTYEEIFEQIMTEDTIVKAVLTKILGDAPGAFLFVGKQEDLNDVAKMMLPVDIAVDEEMTNSALKELVNIIVNAFLNAVTKLLDLQLLSSVPLLTRDLFGSIVSSVYLEQGQYDDTILIIKLEFFYIGNRVESSLYYVPQSRNLEKLFALLGV